MGTINLSDCIKASIDNFNKDMQESIGADNIYTKASDILKRTGGKTMEEMFDEIKTKEKKACMAAIKEAGEKILNAVTEMYKELDKSVKMPEIGKKVINR